MNIPDGWKLVPIIPTEEMLESTNDYFSRMTYRNLLESAPEYKEDDKDKKFEINYSDGIE